MNSREILIRATIYSPTALITDEETRLISLAMEQGVNSPPSTLIPDLGKFRVHVRSVE